MYKIVKSIFIVISVVCFSFNTFSQNVENIYFKIQIAASKVALSNSKLGSICKTSDMLIVEYENNWYKYILRKKFFTYEKALAYKKTINVKGAFVLAYKNEQKVNITEVVNLEDINNNIIVYRLQLGVSTKKANAEAMSWIKSGGKPIITVKYKKYYLYTVGDFTTEAEAKKFKNEKQLNDAKIIKFKNGNPFK